MLRHFGIAVIAAGCLVTTLRAADEKVTYDDHVKPILREKCLSCHNTDKKSGGLDMSTYTGLMLGGGSGAVLEPGDASISYLYMLITHESEPYMPPNSEKIPDDMIATVQKWIDGGALENSGSKPIAKKPKMDLAQSGPTTERPAGPPPLPHRLLLEPAVHTQSTTAVTALATNPWSPLVAVGGQKQIFLYHAEKLELLGVLPFPEGVPHVLKFSRNGSLLLAGGGHGAASGKVVLFDVRTGERVTEIGDELDAVLGADVSPDQTMVALGGPSKVIRIYSTADGSLLHEIKKHTDWVYSVAFSPDGVLLATADRNGGLHVWEALTARPYLTLDGHKGPITDLSWRADSNILASCSTDGSIRLWEMQDGKQVKNWGAHGGGAEAVEFARDGRLVSCGRDKVAKLWDQEGKQQRAFEAFGDLALRVTICDETNRVIAGDWNGLVRVWDAAEGKRLGELPTNPPTLKMRLDAAAQQLAAAQAEHQKQAEALQSAQAAAEKAQTDLAATQKNAADLQAQLDAAMKAVAEKKPAVEKLTADVAAAQKLAAAVQPTIAPLQEAVAKAQQAASALPEDKALAEAVAGLKSQFEKKSADLATAQKTAIDSTAALEKAKQELAAAEKQVAELPAAVKAAQAKATELASAAKTTGEQAAAAKAAVEAAAKAVQAAQQAVARWNEEIAFRDKVNDLKAREAERDKLKAEAERAVAALERLKAELAAAEKASAEARAAADEAVQTAEAAKKEVDALRGGQPAGSEVAQGASK